MAETSLLPLILSFVLLLTIGNQVHCFQNKNVFSLQKLQWRDLKYTQICPPQKSRREKGAMVLEMRHRDYCSDTFKSWDEMLQNRLISDDVRVQSLQSRIKSVISNRIEEMASTQIPVTSGVKVQTLNYIVTMKLGGRKMTVILDTGSDITWVQCVPCVSCYEQQDQLFNPNISRSYNTIMCDSPTCQSLQFATGNSGTCGTNQPTCNYVVNYGDGSFTQGELARERLNFGNTVVKNFTFGCGHNNKGLFGGASGLMGLGRSSLSLISQTSNKFGGVFSYCLPSTETDTSGSLILGRTSSNYTPIVYTNMIHNPQLSTFYFLNLTSLTIGGVNIRTPGFAMGGILIDSGTVITRLVPSVYKALKTEFLKQFSGYPSAPAFSILDTCFNLTGYEEVDIPTLKFEFEDFVHVAVDVSGMFYFVKTDASQVCLALSSLSYEDEVGIIGNYQQKNLRVVYDTKASKLGFAKETCSYK